MNNKKEKVSIRAWHSRDHWWIGSDPRLQFKKQFKKYGIIAKLNYLYAKTFYDDYIVEIVEVSK